MVSLTSTPVPLGEHVPTADQVIVMRGLSWEAFETLLALRGDRSRPKLAYLDGVVELMGTSRGHEKVTSNLGRLVEMYCLERGVPVSAYGNWLQKKEEKEAGVESEVCYVFDAEPQRKPGPDLAIEIVWTSGGIEKLEIYRRLGVGEVWFWENGALSVHVLGAAGYELRARSACLPELDLAVLCRLALVEPMSAALLEFRATLQGNA